MTEELKPCPFCGHVGLDYTDGSTFRWLAYSCGGCGMGSETRVQTMGEGTAAEWMNAAKADAARQWNTRVEQSAWLPIETAPKDQVFLGWISAERWSAADGEGSGKSHDVSQGDFCWWRAVSGSPDGGYFDNGAGQIGDAQAVTHWQPMPTPPSGITSGATNGEG